MSKACSLMMRSYATESVLPSLEQLSYDLDCLTHEKRSLAIESAVVSLEVARLVSGMPFLQVRADYRRERGFLSESSGLVPSISTL